MAILAAGKAAPGFGPLPRRPDAGVVPNAAAADGQFQLFARGVCGRLGGHAAGRAEICEDLARARGAAVPAAAKIVLGVWYGEGGKL